MTWSKRVFDVVLALILGVILAPVIVVVAVLIWRRDGRPVLYISERMKTPDTAFRLWKFRTMRSDARDQGVSGGHKDGRITATGRALRATRLDELPQLYNILKGDLSFVGPRPEIRDYVERFPALQARVLQSRPGVTGLATITYQGHEDRLLAPCKTPEETDAVYARACLPRKARLDLIYQENRSICLDLWLIWRTAARLLPRRLRPGGRRKRSPDG